MSKRATGVPVDREIHAPSSEAPSGRGLARGDRLLPTARPDASDGWSRGEPPPGCPRSGSNLPRDTPLANAIRRPYPSPLSGVMTCLADARVGKTRGPRGRRGRGGRACGRGTEETAPAGATVGAGYAYAEGSDLEVGRSHETSMSLVGPPKYI